MATSTQETFGKMSVQLDAFKPDSNLLGRRDPDKRLLLIVYVDDMKISGPKENIPAAWDRLGKRLGLEVPKGDKPDEFTFLGCTVKFETRQKHG